MASPDRIVTATSLQSMPIRTTWRREWARELYRMTGTVAPSHIDASASSPDAVNVAVSSPTEATT